MVPAVPVTVVVSAAEGIGANASQEQFDDRLADEVATLLTLYLTGVPPRPGDRAP